MDILNIDEPILTAEDHRLWEMWRRTSLVHAKLRRFRHMVDSAKWIIEEGMIKTDGSMAIMLSGGKDSVCMAHVALVEFGLELDVICHKDDCDFPGEEEYVLQLANEWGFNLRVIHPSVSMKALVTELYQSGKLGVADDIHGHSTALSKEHFYQLIEEASAPYRGAMLGLRAEESRGRRMNRIFHGTLYTKKSGQIVCTPIADWSGQDVMAYMASREIDPLPIYKCLALMNSKKPWMIREAWWLPGCHSTDGWVAWLRRYYPSLYSELVRMCPTASMLA